MRVTPDPATISGAISDAIAALTRSGIDPSPRSILSVLAEAIANSIDAPPPPFLPLLQPRVRLSTAGELDPAALGVAHEQLIAQHERRATGSWFTPGAIARAIADLAVDRWFRANPTAIPSVLDPSVGGGVFLVAAGGHLVERLGAARADVASRLYGIELDPLACDIARSAVWLWAAPSTTVEEKSVAQALHENIVLADALTARWAEPDIVIGNPPFLGQLAADTARTPERRQLLVTRFGTAASGYVDEAALFALAAARATTLTRGVVGMILPRTFASAESAASVREEIARSHEISDLWIDHEHVFDANVAVMAPIWTAAPVEGELPTLHRSNAASEAAQTADLAGLLAQAHGVPSAVVPPASASIDSIATVTAGFRQHFYGLRGSIIESADLANASPRDRPRLMTTGTIDPLNDRWGERTVRFDGRRWDAPHVDLGRVDDDAVADWLRHRIRPKVLVATQTTIVEAIADPDGATIPSVPVISLEPESQQPEDVWLLVALLSSPVLSAWFATTRTGSGLSRRTIRVRAKDLAAVPVPDDRSTWSLAAGAARDAQRCAAAGDVDGWSDAIDELGARMMRVHRCNDVDLLRWWRSNVETRAPSARHT